MAGSIVVGTLRALLTLDSAQFEQGIRQVQGSAQQLSGKFKSIGQSATNLGSQLTKTVTLPLAAMFGGALKAAVDFEHSFANVGKTVDGVSDRAGKLTEAGKELAMTFRKMALEIPKTTEELNDIAALGGQMGVPIDKLEEFTKNVAALGVAVDGVSTEEAAAGLAQIGNIAGVGTTQIQAYSSALVHLGNSSNATEGDILEFTKRLMGAGHAVNMSVADVMALGTAMANVGINAEAGGTAMSTMISKMSMAVSKGGDDLEAFARVAQMSAQQFAETWKRSPILAIDAVVQGLAAAKGRGEDLNLVVRDIGATNIRTADTMKRLAGAGTGVADMLKVANEGFSTQDKHLIEAEKKYATTANQLKLLWNAIKDVGISLGDALIPFLKDAIGFAQSLVPVIRSLVDAFSGLPEPAKITLLAGALAAMAAGPVIYGFGQIALSLSAIVGAFGTGGLIAKMTGLGAATTTAGTAAATAAGTAGFGGLAAIMMRFLGAGGIFGLWIAGVAAVGLAAEQLARKIIGTNEDMARSYANSTAGMYGGGISPPKATNRTGLPTGPSRSGNIALPEGRRTDIELSASATGAAKANKDLAVASTQAGAAIAVQGEKTSTTKGKTDEFKDSVTKLADSLGGKDSLGTGNQWVAAVEKMGGVSQLTKSELAQYVTILQKVTEEYRSMGPAGQAVVDKFQALQNQIPLTTQSLISLNHELYMSAARWQPSADGMRRLANESMGLTHDGLIPSTVATIEFYEAVMRAGPPVAHQNDLLVQMAPAARTASESLEMMSRAFDQLASIAGDSLSSVVRGLGTLVSGISLGIEGVKSLREGFASLGSGQILQGLSGVISGISGIVSVGIAGFHAIKGLVKGIGALFGKDEEAREVNPARDKFMAQFGGSQKLAEQLTSWTKEPGGGKLFSAVQSADTMDEFRSAQDDIIAMYAKHGKKGIRKFNLGGFVPPGDVQLGLLHGGRFGEAVMPLRGPALAASQSQQQHTVIHAHFHIKAWDGKDVVQAVRAYVAPELKRMMLLNTDGFATSVGKVTVSAPRMGQR